jgi:GLPGLI family protein
MKINKMKYLIMCCAQLMTVSLFCQTEGRITYEEKVDMHRRIPEERAEMKDMIPHYRSSFFELHFTEDASKYRAVEEDEEEMTGSQGGAHFRMRFSAPRREVYKSLADDRMVDEREFMTKMFLIKGHAAPFEWKIADGQKQILQYHCMKATWQDSVQNYVAWFTPQIPVANGPAEFGGLPGMVMQVEINEGERVITATEVIGETVDEELLKEPKKGKEVTQEEFREIVREKTREMHGSQGGGGPMIIIHQN